MSEFTWRWNDPIDETTDWTHVEFLRMFWRAVRERIVVAAGGQGSGGLRIFDYDWLVEPPVLSTSFDQGNPYPYIGLALLGGWSQGYGTTSHITFDNGTTGYYRFNVNFVNYLQSSLTQDYVLDAFVNPNKSFVGTTLTAGAVLFGAGDSNPANWYLLGRLYDYAHSTYFPATVYQAAGLNPAGFTRKYPKEIFIGAAWNVSSTVVYTDASGNPQTWSCYSKEANTVGQKARFVYWYSKTDEGYSPSVKVFKPYHGKIFVYDGSVWRQSIDPNDTLPDMITAYGPIQAGDYVGPWIWQELRAVLNIMTKSITDAFGPSVIHQDRWFGTFESSLEASYANATLSTSTNTSQYVAVVIKAVTDTYPTNTSDNNYHKHRYSCDNNWTEMKAWRNSDLRDTDNNYLYFPACRATLVVRQLPINGNGTFADFDDGFQNSVWHEWMSFDVAAGAKYCEFTFSGARGKIPLSYAPPVNQTVGHQTVTGNTAIPLLIFNWDVPGGFRYTPSTGQ